MRPTDYGRPLDLRKRAPGTTPRPLPALLAQLKCRTERGEDPARVLDDLAVRRSAARRRYLDALNP